MNETIFTTPLQKYLREHSGLPLWSLELGITGILEQEGWVSPSDDALRQNTTAVERYREVESLLFSREAVILALDTLAVALSNHNHIWSNEDRHIYEQAIKALGMENKV